jgi:microcystin-dependent protein
MAEPFVAEIRLFPFAFAPKGWALCNGQVLPIQQNNALFALIGTTYGGNGTTNFALPDLQGRAAMHFASGVPQGQSAGEESHTLLATEMPMHTHLVGANNSPSTETNPIGNVWGASTNTSYAPTSDATMSPRALAAQGGSQPHPNLQPYLVCSYCIALTGIFPSRS